ncbi:MAG: DNA translocase FtsK 4TM domain-containing protein, partial [Candidatus Eisenbacteria bacterium]
MAQSISEKRQRQMLALVLGAFAILSLASLATFEPLLPGHGPWDSANACGPVGATLAFGLVWALGQAAAFGVPMLAGLWSLNRLRQRPALPLVVTSLIGALLLYEICTLLGLAGLDRWVWAGGWGFAAAMGLHSALGDLGSWIVAGALFGITALAASELGLHWIGPLVRAVVLGPAAGLVHLWKGWKEARAAAAAARPVAKKREGKERKKEIAAELPKVVRAGEAQNGRPRIAVATPGAAIADEAHSGRGGKTPQLELPGLPPRPKPAVKPAKPTIPVDAHPGEAFPSLSLLQMPAQQEDLITAADLTAEANLLVAKLADFGVDGKVTEIHPGPVVTTFEFEPAAGVKVNQIVSREDDLALALRAQRIRILAPIPGKGAVGVEIPNRRRRTVYLREVLSSAQYESSDAALKVPMGVDVVGQPFVADLTKMPHLLVAGSTGSGKSVCLNAIITGLLYQHGPETLQMVMVDPNMLELSAYNGIPHLTMPVVTESKRASRALRWAVAEMEKRYKLMATTGARNIAAYNEKIAKGLVPPPEDGSAPLARLSYVVVVVDELADLMLTAPADIEEPIARLAQMARAVGIHLVLATQRP